LLLKLDPKLINSQNSFSDNLTEEELETLNILLEKYRNKNKN